MSGNHFKTKGAHPGTAKAYFRLERNHYWSKKARLMLKWDHLRLRATQYGLEVSYLKTELAHLRSERARPCCGRFVFLSAFLEYYQGRDSLLKTSTMIFISAGIFILSRY